MTLYKYLYKNRFVCAVLMHKDVSVFVFITISLCYVKRMKFNVYFGILGDQTQGRDEVEKWC